MWWKQRYVADRDPARGGLLITAASHDFPENAGEEIRGNCLELIAKDYGQPCLAVYPLQDGSYSVAMAEKVVGSRAEPRPHEIIRGAVADQKELSGFCSGIFYHGLAKPLFFPEEPDPEKSEQWPLREPELSKETDGVSDFWKIRSYFSVLYLHQALQEMAGQRIKIWLDVPSGEEERMLAVICAMQAETGGKLFVMANGECTQRKPDILITDRLRHLSEREYHRLTFEQLLEMGKYYCQR